MGRRTIFAALVLFGCGDDASGTFATDAGAASAPVPPSASESASLSAEPTARASSPPGIELPPSVSAGLPSPQSVLTTKDIVEVFPTDMRRKLLGCWKLASGEEWRITARGKQGLELTQKLPPSSPSYLTAPKAVVVKFSASERSVAFTSVGGHHPCLIACAVGDEKLSCSAACSRRPGDGFPAKTGHPVAERCSLRP